MRVVSALIVVLVACSAGGTDQTPSSSAPASTQQHACPTTVTGQAVTMNGRETEFNVETCKARAESDAKAMYGNNPALVEAYVNRTQAKCEADDGVQRSLETFLDGDQARQFPCFSCPQATGCIGKHQELDRSVYCISQTDSCYGRSDVMVGSGGSAAATAGSSAGGSSASGTDSHLP